MPARAGSFFRKLDLWTACRCLVSSYPSFFSDMQTGEHRSGRCRVEHPPRLSEEDAQVTGETSHREEGISDPNGSRPAADFAAGLERSVGVERLYGWLTTSIPFSSSSSRPAITPARVRLTGTVGLIPTPWWGEPSFFRMSMPVQRSV